MDDKTKKKPQWVVKHTLLLLLSLVIACGLGEGILRLFLADRLIIQKEERALLYRYDERLGWFPQENSVHTFTGSQTISVAHNSRGFRDIEHHKSSKPGILFLGDSFVWGYDVEISERFTEKLRLRLPDWAIYNLGVSGYSTDQEYLLLQDQFDHYQPRIVFLVFCVDNDEIDNASNNIGYAAYYKPYFDPDNQGMTLRGIPVPKSLTYFGRKYPWLTKSYMVRLVLKAVEPPFVHVSNPTEAIIHELNKFVINKGSVLVVGLEKPHPVLEHYLKSEGILYLQLNYAERFPTHGFHWTPAGHTTVSNDIYDFLLTKGLLNIEVEN